MLTARSDETDLLVGLGVGADDYVTKPFSMREVVARVRALLRRVERAAVLAGSGRARIEVAGLVIDPATRRVTSGGVEVHLTPLEFDLLHALATEPGTVRTRDALMREVWGWADAAGTRTLDSHVKAVRAKIGADRVRTVHGVGYALEVGDVKPDASARHGRVDQAPSSACSSGSAWWSPCSSRQVGDAARCRGGSACP